MAVRAFKAVDGTGLARVDFLLNGATGELYLNEINTMPGFTRISMFPKLWEASGTPYANWWTCWSRSDSSATPTGSRIHQQHGLGSPLPRSGNQCRYKADAR